MSAAAQRTAFVFAGGGSLGAVQVGMLRELMHAGVSADLVVGFSVGAMNAAYFAGAPNAAGVDKLEKVWRGLSTTEAGVLRGLGQGFFARVTSGNACRSLANWIAPTAFTSTV